MTFAGGLLIAEGRLEPALLLWRGELLAGLHLENAPEFDAWLEARREALAYTLRKVQLEQAERLETRGDWHAALELNQKILKADRLQERQHREVMRLQYLLGQREAALVHGQPIFCGSLENYEKSSSYAQATCGRTQGSPLRNTANRLRVAPRESPASNRLTLY